MDNTKITAFQVASVNSEIGSNSTDDEELELASTTSNMSFLKKLRKVSKCQSHTLGR